MKNKFWNYFLWLLLIVLIFTAIDALVHATVGYLEIYYYPIPASLSFISTNPLFWYAFGKFFGSIIIGILIYPLVKRINSYWLKILVFSLSITILLEIRYMLSGYYAITWDLLNFLQHTITLYIVSYLIFLKSKVFNKN